MKRSKCRCRYLSMLALIDARDYLLTDWQQGLIDQIRETVNAGRQLTDDLEDKLDQLFALAKSGKASHQ